MGEENRNGSTTFDFADGPHHFRLAMGELEELQEQTGVGPYKLLRNFLAGEWKVGDISHTIRLGLIGGGMDPPLALKMVRRYVHERSNWIANAEYAKVILVAALTGAPEEVPGKSDAPGTKTEEASSSSQTDASSSESTIDQRQPSE